MKKIFICILSLLLMLTFFSSCGKSTPGNEESTDMKESGTSLKIVTTIFPIYDWVCNITGSSENVTYLENSGADLHNFDPTTKDILTISQADVFIYVGGTSDKWVSNALKSANNPSLVTLSVMDSITAFEEETVEGMEAEQEESGETEYDEHIWLSLRNAEKIVSAIDSALEKADSANSEKYKNNADSYITKLKNLDSEYTEMISSGKRNTVLFADRFPFLYFVRDYNLNYYAAFVGCSAESEASFATMSFLIEKTKELSLPYVLVLEGSDCKIADTVCNASGASTLTVNSCQSVTQNDIDGGTSYLKIMESNLEVFREALS